MYTALGEPGEQESDLLDLASEVTETSRLGCQVKVTRNLSGLEVKLPGIARELKAKH